MWSVTNGIIAKGLGHCGLYPLRRELGIDRLLAWFNRSGEAVELAYVHRETNEPCYDPSPLHAGTDDTLVVAAAELGQIDQGWGASAALAEIWADELGAPEPASGSWQRALCRRTLARARAIPPAVAGLPEREVYVDLRTGQRLAKERARQLGAQRQSLNLRRPVRAAVRSGRGRCRDGRALDDGGRREQMSDLIVIGYDNPQTARQAYQQVQRLQQDFVVELRGLAIVDVDADGKTHVDTPQRIIGTSAAHGALFGLLLGLLFFVPGMVLLGGAIGALMGTLTKSGIDAEFRNRVEHLVEPGHSAVVIMASKITEDKFAGAMQPFGGTILKTSLSERDERELAEELSRQS